MSTKSYKCQAKFFLEDTFPFVSCAAINAIFKHVESNFSDAHQILSKIMNEHQNNDGAVTAALPQLQLKVKIFLKNQRIKKRIRIRDERLLDEIAQIEALNNKDNTHNEMMVIDDDMEEPSARVFECLCCFGEYPDEEVKAVCSSNSLHLVCQLCTNSYVREQVDGNNRVDFTCMVDTECKGVYPPALLDKVLSPNLNRRTNDACFRHNVEKSGMKVWRCSKCANIGFLGARTTIVHCAQCDKWYCVSCKDIQHFGKTCQENSDEKQRLADPDVQAQEAMSEAVTRRCPNPTCRITFVKGDGCNKMTCSACKTLSCYLCGQQVYDYEHFCKCNLEAGPCKCNKTCRLWIKPGDMAILDNKSRYRAAKKVYKAAGKSPDEIQRLLASLETKEGKRPNRPIPPIDVRVGALRLVNAATQNNVIVGLQEPAHNHRAVAGQAARVLHEVPNAQAIDLAAPARTVFAIQPVIAIARDPQALWRPEARFEEPPQMDRRATLVDQVIVRAPQAPEARFGLLEEPLQMRPRAAPVEAAFQAIPRAPKPRRLEARFDINENPPLEDPPMRPRTAPIEAANPVLLKVPQAGYHVAAPFGLAKRLPHAVPPMRPRTAPIEEGHPVIHRAAHPVIPQAVLHAAAPFGLVESLPQAAPPIRPRTAPIEAAYQVIHRATQPAIPQAVLHGAAHTVIPRAVEALGVYNMIVEEPENPRAAPVEAARTPSIPVVAAAIDVAPLAAALQVVGETPLAPRVALAPAVASAKQTYCLLM